MSLSDRIPEIDPVEREVPANDGPARSHLREQPTPMGGAAAQVESPFEVIHVDALKNSARRDRRSSIIEIVSTLAIVIVLVVLVRMFVGEPYEVPTGSMLETIQMGDRLFGEKISYRLRDPWRGEVVTFVDPDPEKGGVTLIKRVIATAGQEVDIRDGMVYVDGVPLDEPYTLGKPTEPIAGHASNLSEDISYPYVVPEGCIWVMGDNRTNSLDSRYFGAVSVDSVTSRAVVIFWPPSDAGLL